MDITKVVAKARMKYHLAMVDVVNVAYQLNLMSGEKADRANENHLKQIIDCWDRLGIPVCKELREFKNGEA
jgi:hypothetical protein